MFGLRCRVGSASPGGPVAVAQDARGCKGNCLFQSEITRRMGQATKQVGDFRGGRCFIEIGCCYCGLGCGAVRCCAMTEGSELPIDLQADEVGVDEDVSREWCPL